ncbi:ATP-binding cassette domain-containing protein [Silvibacterium dinghuense]|uniref:ATP-binding cassette domain-containing protein n=1 Tax=Silvibacterium dinghuense TaxID=1560006 RepID=A0A4Q1S7L4_9BACT|nr:ATP-binding cassette domain-containing protein [Silvibacterium dinghuense]RXS92790.1 ATP-binding cassette domain-containing protein [Silvibacterium dinghuense]
MSLTSSNGNLVLIPRRIPRGPYFALHHVSKAFGSTLVLDDVSFNVNRGNTLCIIDSSGAGKTILHLLMEFLKPDSGQVIAENEDISDFSQKLNQPISRKIVMVFEDGTIFRPSTSDKIKYSSQRIQMSLRQERSRETRRWRAAVEALAENPEAILLDRSKAKTSPCQMHHLEALFRRRKAEGKTSIVLTEESSVIRRIADQVLLLEDGSVRFSGTLSEMTRTRNLIDLPYQWLDQRVLSLP